MKIVFLTSEYPPGPGGIGDQAYSLTKMLLRANLDVTVLTELRSRFSKTEGEGREQGVWYIADNDYLRLLKFIGYYLLILIKYKKFLVIFSGLRSLKVGSLVNLIFCPKSLVILHGHELYMCSNLMRPLIKRFLRNANRLIAVSVFSKSNILKALPKAHVTVISNGIDLEKLQAIMTASSSKYKDVIKLLTVGRVCRRKGQHNVIAAMPALLQMFPRLEYHVAGVIDKDYDIRTVAETYGVGDRLMIHGYLENEDLYQLVAGSTIAIMLSERSDNGDVEGFGISLVECNFFGIPSIGARGCGIEDAIEHGSSGFLVMPDDAQEVCSAVREIISNYERYSDQARVWAHKHDWNFISRRYLSIINEVID